ncbi:MAG: hypothetical protein ACKOUS_03525, partial [Alphaproteobacteria bacterium]
MIPRDQRLHGHRGDGHGPASQVAAAPRRDRQRRFLAWAGAGALALIAGGILHLARAGASHEDGS